MSTCDFDSTGTGPNASLQPRRGVGSESLTIPIIHAKMRNAINVPKNIIHAHSLIMMICKLYNTNYMQEFSMPENPLWRCAAASCNIKKIELKQSFVIFTEEQLITVLIDLFDVGSETTSNTMEFAILYMVLHPNVQARVQAEIDEVIGSSRYPVYADKAK